MKTYRVAIVGLGRMASTIDEEMPDVSTMDRPYSIAASCKASDRLELVAGADVAAEKRTAFQKRWAVENLYEDYLEMVEKERPDLVAVCTTASGLPRFESERAPYPGFTTDLHAEMALRLAEAGVPILYVEKAMACSMRAADAVLAACRRHGTVFNTGVLRRFDYRWQVLRDLIERGDIGEPKAAVHYGSTNLMHNHIHSIDTLSYLLGDPGGRSGPRGTIATGVKDSRQPAGP